jgi:hypothetical protein
MSILHAPFLFVVVKLFDAIESVAADAVLVAVCEDRLMLMHCNNDSMERVTTRICMIGQRPDSLVAR